MPGSGKFSFHYTESFASGICSGTSISLLAVRPRSTALHMGITKAVAHGYNICVSLRPRHDCGDGVCCTGITILFICFVLSFCGLIDFHSVGGLFISQFDIEIRSQTHEVGP